MLLQQRYAARIRHEKNRMNKVLGIIIVLGIVVIIGLFLISRSRKEIPDQFTTAHTFNDYGRNIKLSYANPIDNISKTKLLSFDYEKRIAMVQTLNRRGEYQTFSATDGNEFGNTRVFLNRIEPNGIIIFYLCDSTH
jgi:hypothetical protein